MPTYRIPKHRKVAETIKMTNGNILTREVDDSGYSRWFKNGKYITPSVLKTYKFYDKSIGGYRQLKNGKDLRMFDGKGINSATPVYTPTINKIESNSSESNKKKEEIRKKQQYKSNGKYLTLKTKGNMNLVDIPTNMLDSIAINTGRSKTNIKTNLGLVGKESTFGGYSHFLNNPWTKNDIIDPHALTNNHSYFIAPEDDYIKSLYKYIPGSLDKDKAARERRAKEDLKYHNGIPNNGKTPHYSPNIMADAFKRYAVSPLNYNPGQNNYIPMINAIGNEVWSEPQIQHWWNTEGKYYYNKGRNQGINYTYANGGPLDNTLPEVMGVYPSEVTDNQYAEGGVLDAPKYWDDLSLSEKNDVMAAAVKNGITNLHDIRDKWNEFADEGERDNTEDSAEDHMYYTGGPVMPWDNNMLLNPMQQQLMQSHPLEAIVAADGGHLFKKGGKENLANTRARQAIGYFMNKGLTKAQASGLVGNLMRESEGLNPAAENPYSHTYGLAQWLGPRKKELFRRYGSHPTFNQQLDYIWSELNTTHRKGLQKLLSSKTADDAARNAFGYYEFSGGPEAAIADMNSHGKKTKWKNPDGYSAMMNGVNNARKLMGQSPLSYSSYDYSDSPSFSDMLGTPRRKPLTFEESMQSPAINYEVPKVVLPMPEDSKPEPSPTMSAADKLDHFNALMSLLGMESPLPSATSYLQGILGSKPNNPDGSLFGTLSLLSGNTFAEGGKEDNSKGNDNTIIHPFTWDRPFTYNGKQYPTAISVDNNTGLPMQTFADNSGNVFTMDGDTAVPATFVHDIEGPTVLYSKTLHKQVPVNANGSIDYSKLSFMDNYRLANNLLEQRGEQSAYDPNGFMDFMNAATLGLGNRLSVSQNARLVKDTYDAATGNKSWGDVVNSAILGNEGIFENPWANLALDITVPTVGGNYRNIANVGKYKANETAKEAVSNPNVFASELNWSPENWFGTRTTGAFDAEDVAALRAHIPEYHAIEKAAKKNGTWLKMPDGSTWEGDPRSWVQLQSKDGQKLLQKPLYHGDSNIYLNTNGNDVTPSTLGKGVLWASSNKHLPLTYGNRHYTLAIPKGTPMVEINARGRNWNNLKGLNLGYKDTNDVSWDLLNNDNVVRIKDVVDIGSDPRWRPGRNGLPQAVPNEELTHYIDRVFKGDDYIFGEDIPRKSLLGNNGNFDLTKSNIYKGLIPFALPIGMGYSSLNKN